MDAYIQENARDINLYMEFYSLGDISTIINQLKSQNVQIYDIDIERNKSGEALHPSAIFSIRLNEKYRTRSFSPIWRSWTAFA